MINSPETLGPTDSTAVKTTCGSAAFNAVITTFVFTVYLTDGENPDGTPFFGTSVDTQLGWALAAAWMARRAGAIQRGMHWLDRVAGAMFIGFGLKLAFTDQPPA